MCRHRQERHLVHVICSSLIGASNSFSLFFNPSELRFDADENLPGKTVRGSLQKPAPSRFQTGAGTGTWEPGSAWVHDVSQPVIAGDHLRGILRRRARRGPGRQCHKAPCEVRWSATAQRGRPRPHRVPTYYVPTYLLPTYR